MKKYKFSVFSIIALAVFLASFPAWTGAIGLDDFSSSKVGNFPKRWRTWPLQRSDAASVYSVQEENGARFIRAYDDHDASQQIFLNFDWRAGKKPNFSWGWRAQTLPSGARENDDALNDSACGVYMVVGRMEGHAIKYVWSSTLPDGSVVTRRDGKLKIKVLESGAGNKGKWMREKVNVASDYETLFGRKLSKNPSGIAILTDGNAVHKPAGCDYTDFAISE